MRRRFVVSRHDVKPGDVHFDFMVERGDKLATWRLEGPLGPARGARSFDHRLVYLDYEGEISGGRGRVSIVERGDLEDVEGDPDAARWVFAIGERRYELAGAGTAEGASVSVRPLG